MPARQPLSAFNRNVLSRLWRVRVSRALRAGDVANWLADRVSGSHMTCHLVTWLVRDPVGDFTMEVHRGTVARGDSPF